MFSKDPLIERVGLSLWVGLLWGMLVMLVITKTPAPFPTFASPVLIFCTLMGIPYLARYAVRRWQKIDKDNAS